MIQHILQEIDAFRKTSKKYQAYPFSIFSVQFKSLKIKFQKHIVQLIHGVISIDNQTLKYWHIQSITRITLSLNKCTDFTNDDLSKMSKTLWQNRIGYSVDPYQTAPQEAVWSGSVLSAQIRPIAIVRINTEKLNQSSVKLLCKQ